MATKANDEKKQKKKYVYEIDYFVTMEGLRGKKRVHIQAHNKKEESVKLLRAQKKLEAGIYGSSNMTFRQWEEQWYADRIENLQITGKSKSMYPSIINKWILPVIGDIPLNRHKKYDCDMVLDRMGKLSKSYQTKCKRILQMIVRAAYDKELIARDYSENIKISTVAADAKKRRALTDEERRAVEKVCMMETLSDGRPNDSGALFLTMLYCGLRPGECCALRKKDLDLDHATIHVRQARECGSRNIKDPKSESGKRNVPLTDEYVYMMRFWMREHKNASEYVFTQRDKKSIITDSSLQRRWETYKKHIARELGAEPIITKNGRKKSTKYDTSIVTFDPYCLRHSYATELILANVSRWDIARYMGHADPSVVDETYGHPSDKMDKESREKIVEYRSKRDDELLSNILPEDIARLGMGKSEMIKYIKEYNDIFEMLEKRKNTEPDWNGVQFQYFNTICQQKIQGGWVEEECKQAYSMMTGFIPRENEEIYSKYVIPYIKYQNAKQMNDLEENDEN